MCSLCERHLLSSWTYLLFIQASNFIFFPLLTLFRCSDCAQDSDCPSDQFCFGKILPWVCNKCRAPQPDGAWCLEDSQCENLCSGGRCGPCKSHDDCTGDLYCRNLFVQIPMVRFNLKSSWIRWLPGLPTYCSSPQPNGQICLESKECQNSCSLGVCSECTKDSDCQVGEFCRNKSWYTLIENQWT